MIHDDRILSPTTRTVAFIPSEQHETMRSHMRSRSLTLKLSVQTVLLSVLGFLYGSVTISFAQNDEKVIVHLRNDGPLRIQIGWVGKENQTVVPMGILEPFAVADLKSSYNHKFELRESPKKGEQGGKCTLLKRIGVPVNGPLRQGVDGCAMTRFQAEDLDDQYLLISDIMSVEDDELMYSFDSFEHRDASKHVSICRNEAKRRFSKAKSAGLASSSETTDRILQQLEVCMSMGVAPSLKRSTDRIKFEASVRREVSQSIERYTCNSEVDESTPDVDVRSWTSRNDNLTRVVHVKFDRPATRIHVVDGFASPLECNTMEERVEGRLGPATTADGKGGFQLNENRKALQSEIDSDWSQEESGDPILALNRRIFEYTNDVLGMNLSPEGQEPLMSIQYFGRGYDDPSPDRYNSHCDGRCEGEPHRYAARMATMVVYCTVPDRGGMTNFNNAGVTIKPVAGSAIFFSYIDPLTNLTDKGFSQHSGCPVYEGKKAIITQWIRMGVTEEITADHYNSLDILVSDDD